MDFQFDDRICQKLIQIHKFPIIIDITLSLPAHSIK